MNKIIIHELLKFGVAGGITFIIDYGLLYICTEYIRINYFYSSAIAFTIALTFNYWLCLRFVFCYDSRQKSSNKLLFFASSVIGLGINQICMYLLVEFFLVQYMLAKCLSTIFVFSWNYIMKRKAVKQ